ncbi:Fur family transcriptional regulator [Clostridium aestuarii]|uniref:Fur family transcriptional regulator n=1 Tax=Clostridium aestuarii TaxID=338193 RepID=A0ABT4D094_9CLOT|nr:Fur family transcriptional regulator [Clostridium aestuarii]MCY6484042.1 Fur family transcriptional regulator [Clostridium aestuarii]
MSKVSSSQIDRLKDKLKLNGYKLTPQRRAIVNIIIENKGKHLTAEELYDLVKIECPEIGLATVYRTIQLLEEIGIVYKLSLDDGCNRYELVNEDQVHQHHHLICTKCGKVIEVEGDLLDSIEKKLETKYKFKIQNHSVKFFGICDKCI